LLRYNRLAAQGVEMARGGETIEHPFSGERLTFLETAATTQGEFPTPTAASAQWIRAGGGFPKT
jgi:hypothetical protein